MLKKTWYIQAYKAVIWSQLTRSTGDFPVNSIWVLDICQINSCEIQQRMNIPGNNDKGASCRFLANNCGGDLSVIFRAWPPVHNNSIFTAAFSKKLTIASSSLMTLVPGDFADKEIFYIVDCHNVTLLLKSEAGFKLRFIRFWFILWFSRHLLGQIPLPLVDISAGSRHGREEVEVLEVARLQTAPSVWWP